MQTTRSEHYKTLVTQFINACTSDTVSSFKAFHIGKSGGSKLKPLTVIFKDLCTVIELSKGLKSANLADINSALSKISYTHDRPPAERKYLADLRSSLKDRLESGETDLTIKYISEIPKIVKKESKIEQLSCALISL